MSLQSVAPNGSPKHATPSRGASSSLFPVKETLGVSISSQDANSTSGQRTPSEGISSILTLGKTSTTASVTNNEPSFASVSLGMGAPYSCLDSFNYPIISPRYTVHAELLSPTKRRVMGGSPADSITGGNATSAAPSAKPAENAAPKDAKTKPLYYETCVCLSDFIKAVYGIVGPTTGASPSGRDVGTSSLTFAQRLENRRLLYKNVSPETPNGTPRNGGQISSDVSNNSTPSMNCAPRPQSIPNAPSPKPRRLLLALDLDETLVHAFIGLKEPLPGADAHVEITTTLGNPPRKSVNAMYVRYRPGISDFMSAVAPLFDVVLFTAARPIYAETLMNVMDPRGSVVAKDARYFRDSCTDIYNRYDTSIASQSSVSTMQASNGSVIESTDAALVAAVAAEAGCEAGLGPLAEPGFVRSKDLTKLGRPLHEIVLVDNTATCGLLQPRNLLPISSWFGADTKDTGLVDIIPVLKKIHETRDVYGCLDEYCARMQPVV